LQQKIIRNRVIDRPGHPPSGHFSGGARGLDRAIPKFKSKKGPQCTIESQPDRRALRRTRICRRHFSIAIDAKNASKKRSAGDALWHGDIARHVTARN